jgi:hypothetical protein
VSNTSPSNRTINFEMCNHDVDERCQSSEVSKLSSLHTVGVNRLSLGIQSLRDEDLPILGNFMNDPIHDICHSSPLNCHDRT